MPGLAYKNRNNSNGGTDNGTKGDGNDSNDDRNGFDGNGDSDGDSNGGSRSNKYDTISLESGVVSKEKGAIKGVVQGATKVNCFTDDIMNYTVQIVVVADEVRRFLIPSIIQTYRNFALFYPKSLMTLTFVETAEQPLVLHESGISYYYVNKTCASQKHFRWCFTLPLREGCCNGKNLGVLPTCPPNYFIDDKTAFGCKVQMALASMQSEFIIFLDSDDFYGPTYLRSMVSALVRQNLDYTTPRVWSAVTINVTDNNRASDAGIKISKALASEKGTGQFIGLRRNVFTRSSCSIERNWQWDGYLAECIRLLPETLRAGLADLTEPNTMTKISWNSQTHQKYFPGTGNWSGWTVKQFGGGFLGEYLSSEEKNAYRQGVIDYLMSRHNESYLDRCIDQSII